MTSSRLLFLVESDSSCNKIKIDTDKVHDVFIGVPFLLSSRYLYVKYKNRNRFIVIK